MTTLHTMVGAALAAVCLFPLAQDRAAPAAKPTVAATVDVSKAIDQSPKWARSVAILNEMNGRGQARMAELTKMIAEAKATIDVMSADSLERQQAQFQYETLLRQREFEAKAWKEKMDVEEMRYTLACYDEVAIVIAKVAKSRGVQIVHRTFELDEAKGDPLMISPREVVTRSRVFDRKQIWYAAPEVDLTADVIKELQIPQPDKGGAAIEAGSPSKPDAPKPDAPKPDAPKPAPGTSDPKNGG